MNEVLKFAVWTLAGFAATEIFSYFAHRVLFHGVLWRIHVTHHTARKGFFEANDVFSLFFALVSIGLIVSRHEIAAPVGVGIALYGLIYFITHDLFTHRRFAPFNSKNKILRTVRAAHQRHHQTAEKQGLEPFGLFIFNYRKFYAKITREKSLR